MKQRKASKGSWVRKGRETQYVDINRQQRHKILTFRPRRKKLYKDSVDRKRGLYRNVEVEEKGHLAERVFAKNRRGIRAPVGEKNRREGWRATGGEGEAPVFRPARAGRMSNEPSRSLGGSARRHRGGRRSFGAPAFWLHLCRRTKVEKQE